MATSGGATSAFWELTARERIRDSLARYTWSGDTGRLSELAEAFCENGELEIRGREPLRGRSAIMEFLGGVVAARDEAVRETLPGESGRSSPTARTARRIVRHNVANVRFLELLPHRALVASYFTVLTEIGLDHYGRYRDTFVPVGDEWLIRHRFVSTDWRAADSRMAPPSAIG